MNPYDQYLENQVMTASPGKLLVMTFDAAIRFTKTAKDHAIQGKLDSKSEYTCKTQNILLELIASLDSNADPQLAANLNSLYNFAFNKLTAANIKNDVSAYDEVIEILTELRTTWVEAETLIRSGVTSQLPAQAAA